jgi:phosphatidate cytidylyltransferase
MKRVLTAFPLVIVSVYTALFAPQWLFLAMVAIVAVLCFREYAAITGSFAPAGYAVGLLILFVPRYDLVPLIVLSALGVLCCPLGATDLERGFAKATALLMGILYIFGSWRMATLLHDSAGRPAALRVPAGHHWLLFGLMVSWIGDTGAYYIGKNFGRRKLAPLVSPGKTWEGAAASAVTGVVFGVIYLPLAIPGTSVLVAGLAALATNIAGQLGDLAESAIKRGAGVKDSGSLLPGHGGMLDRVDSSLFALPVLYSLLPLLR